MEISTSRLRDHKWKIPVPDGPIYGEHVTWKKGGVENSICPMLRYLPGTTDLEVLPTDEIEIVKHQYNNCPRKSLATGLQPGY